MKVTACGLSVKVGPHFFFEPLFILSFEFVFVDLHFVPHLLEHSVFQVLVLGVAPLSFLLDRAISIVVRLDELPIVFIVKITVELSNLVFVKHAMLVLSVLGRVSVL